VVDVEVLLLGLRWAPWGGLVPLALEALFSSPLSLNDGCDKHLPDLVLSVLGLFQHREDVLLLGL
jgi:hypothetical protein